MTESPTSWIPFPKKVEASHVDLTRLPLKQLQINVGKLCNQACLHCHVDAGPNKIRENMDRPTVDRIIELVKKSPEIETIDLTGGAPEMNPHFRFMVETFRGLGKEILDRCNLTVLFEKNQEDTAEFLAKNKVKIVASLPCYSKDNVEKQRGDGVFDLSIKGLTKLNQLGYGQDPDLQLDLVYNPTGPFLPPTQQSLKEEYKERLLQDFNIQFNDLYTITNMPIKRFLYDLKKNGNYQEYMQLLLDNFNPQAASQVMCRSFLSLSWDGKIFDCDFNQMLNMPIQSSNKNIWDIESFEHIQKTQIALADHCYGCTAGAGSSCGGSLTD